MKVFHHTLGWTLAHCPAFTVFTLNLWLMWVMVSPGSAPLSTCWAVSASWPQLTCGDACASCTEICCVVHSRDLAKPHHSEVVWGGALALGLPQLPMTPHVPHPQHPWRSGNV